VSGVNDLPLAELEQTEELAGNEDLALAVLPRNVQADLTRLPAAVLTDPEGVAEHELLFGV
jgi:hypothetical protein